MPVCHGIPSQLVCRGIPSLAGSCVIESNVFYGSSSKVDIAHQVLVGVGGDLSSGNARMIPGKPAGTTRYHASGTNGGIWRQVMLNLRTFF